MKISVILPTFNPDRDRLADTLSALAAQTLDFKEWEIVLVDNASSPPVDARWCRKLADNLVRVVREPEPGLSYARLAGLTAATADTVLFCDDDNVLEGDYLTLAVEMMERSPSVGVAGGRSLPLYLEETPAWYVEGMAPLGCRDLGDSVLDFSAEDFQEKRCYPRMAPIGAGMVARKAAIQSWSRSVGRSGISDRKGNSLSSAGDCDMVLHALESGFGVAYWPSLVLQHLIPQSRLKCAYLSAISRAASRDFLTVLGAHGISPWSPISSFTIPLRALRSFVRVKPWKSPVNRIRWFSDLGHFEGRSKLRM